MMIRTVDKPVAVVDRRSAIKALNAFFGRHGVDGIECPSGFKGFDIEAVHLWKRSGKSGISGKNGKVYAFIRIGRERIPVLGYIMDGFFSALVAPAAFAEGPKREHRPEVRKRMLNVLGAFRAHFEEWNRDRDIALMFRVMENCLGTVIRNFKPDTKRLKKGG